MIMTRESRGRLTLLLLVCLSVLVHALNASENDTYFEAERHHRLNNLLREENLSWEALPVAAGQRFTIQFRSSVEHPAQVEAEQNAFLDYLKKRGIKVRVRYRYTGVMNGLSVQLEPPDDKLKEEAAENSDALANDGADAAKRKKKYQDSPYKPNEQPNDTVIAAASLNGTANSDAEIFHPSVFLTQTLKNCPFIRQYWPGKRYKRPNVIHAHPIAAAIRQAATNGTAKARNGQGFMDPGFANLDNAHKLTGVDKVKQAGYTGKGIKVAILDSGVDYTHPSLGKCFGPGCLIEYGYDLVGDEYGGTSMTTQPDANPLDLCDGHGTHVAGILAARDRVKGFEGVAPDVSLGVWRIFGCKGDTDDDIILAAAEMAADAGMDIINLSLGGGVSAWSEDALAVALSNLSKKGITVVVAQGNEGRDGIARTPSPAIGDQVISSGSADNTVKLAHIMHIFQNGHEITSFEYVTGDGPDFVLGGKPQQLVLLPAGSEGDTACDAILKDIHDKIVVARRGDCDFGQKAMQVQNAGGSGVIVYSNPEEDSVSIDLHRYSRIRIPVVSISGEDGELLMNLYHETQGLDQPFTAKFLSEQVPVKGGGLMSVFSTWGPDPELHLKPDIIGIGGHLYSTYPHTLGWYRSMSGTSMATPYISGCIALYMQATGERDPRNIIDHLINYAEPMVALHDEAHLESVAKQGPGLIQLQDAILSSTHVYPSKISLNDTEHFKNSFTLFIENVSKEPKTYQVDHLPALAVNGYDFAKSSVPLEKATHLYVNASVQFDYDTVEINPFGSETLNVTFAQPVIDKSSKFKHLVYSGYIRLRQVDDDGEMIASKAIHVPYFGVLGNQRDLPIFERGYPYIGLSNGRPILPRSKTKARVTYDFKRGDKVHLFLRLGSPSAQVRCEVFDRRNKWVGYIPNYENSWVARNDHSDEFFDNTISWHGQLSPDLFSKSAPISIQKGTYRIRVKALKIYGDPNVASDWENWTSFEFDVV